MIRNLHDNIDKFFLDNLKDYGEEPNDNTWTEIDKRLSEKEQRRIPTRRIVSLSAAAVVIGLLMPFVLRDVYFHPKSNNNKSANNIFRSQIEKPDKSALPFDRFITGKVKNSLSKKSASAVDNSANHYTESNLLNSHFNKGTDSILTISKFFFPDKMVLKQTAPSHKSKDSMVVNDDVAINKQTTINKTSTVISVSSNKHKIGIIPFFSVDHISGRFIEQYEFDNEDKNDYNNREKPDMSFTGGLLVAYKINKKFSLTSGVSISKAAIAISSTAVNALKDENGIYKFKLATSYGFAEISKTGITPTAGDSLFVSNGMMQLNYISFPVFLNYNFGNKKIKWSIHAGVALNKVMSDKVQIEYTINNNDDNETVNKIEGVRRTFFALNTGVEAKYSITGSIDVGLSPELRYGINSINKGTPVKTYPINYGLSANIHIKL